MKIKEDLPSCCQECKKFILKVDGQVTFIGKIRTRSLIPHCKFINVCEKVRKAHEQGQTI